MADSRSRRSHAPSTGVWPLGARVRRTVGSGRTGLVEEHQMGLTAERVTDDPGNSSPTHLATSLSLRSRALRGASGWSTPDAA